MVFARFPLILDLQIMDKMTKINKEMTSMWNVPHRCHTCMAAIRYGDLNFLFGFSIYVIGAYGWMDFTFPNIWGGVIMTSALRSIISTCHDHDGLISMFVLLRLLSDTQSHGTSIAVWGETAITGFVLHASKAHCLEMWVPSLICVSAHVPLRRYRTAPVANGGDAEKGWKPIHHTETKKKPVRGGQWERGGGGTGGGRGSRMAPLYFIVLKGYSSRRAAVRLPVWTAMGGIKAMPNSFMGTDVEKWPTIRSHRWTAADQTQECWFRGRQHQRC